MVTYGPWIQDPDVEGPVARTTVRTAVFAGVQTPFQDPRYGVLESDLQDAFDAARETVTEGGNLPEFLNIYGVAITQGYELVFPNWKTSWGAEVNRHLVSVSQGVFSYNPPDYGFPAPEGAIGIDYEALPYDPEEYPWRYVEDGTQLNLRLIAASRFEGFWYDDQGTGDWSLSTAPGSTLMLSAGGSEINLATIPPPPSVGVPDISNPVETTLGYEIDLTGDLEPNGWTGQLWLAHSFSAPKEDPALGNGTKMYGWGIFGLGFAALWRPPLYRWVFPGDPIRRVFPRDDALAGGAPRVGISSRAVQSSNRVGNGSVIV